MIEGLQLGVVEFLEQEMGERAVWPCWDASHIRRQPCDYRDAGSNATWNGSAVFLNGIGMRP